jgi:hypothetical protein
MATANTSTDELFARLRRSIEAEDPNAVSPVISELGDIAEERNRVPDEIVGRLLALLDTILDSPVAGQVLEFFDYQASRLTSRQKRQVLEFLGPRVDRFTGGDSRHIATEILEDTRLRGG